jgi:hypothetical protein
MRKNPLFRAETQRLLAETFDPATRSFDYSIARQSGAGVIDRQ